LRRFNNDRFIGRSRRGPPSLKGTGGGTTRFQIGFPHDEIAHITTMASVEKSEIQEKQSIGKTDSPDDYRSACSFSLTVTVSRHYLVPKKRRRIFTRNRKGSGVLGVHSFI
jgi:hypothetical protein